MVKISIRQTKQTGVLPKEENIFQNHKEMLRDSAISPEIIQQRGYRTIRTPNQLMNVGFDFFQAQATPGLLIPLHHVSEKIDTENSKLARYQYRPDTPRLNDKGKPVKYETPAGSTACLDIPVSMRPHLLDVNRELWVTEGSKKADAAASKGLCCLSVMGVWNFDVPDWQHIALKHRRVYICFDSDVMTKPEVAEALRRFAALLRSKGATVLKIYLPAGESDEKVGLDDYFANGGTVEHLKSLRKPQHTTVTPDGLREHLPTIQTENRQLAGLVDETLEALVAANDPPSVYAYGGKLTRIQFDKMVHTTTARLQSIHKDALLDILSRDANFVSVSTKGRRSVNPPDVVARMILEQPGWSQIPSLAGVVNTPIFASDGTLCDAPGYNSAANIYLHLPEKLELLDTTPTKENVSKSRTRIDNLLYDFPFANDASKAHAIAFMLLPFVREMIEGPTPLHLFSAPKAGTGKSLLMSTLARVSVRYGVALQTASKDEEEWRKRLTTQFREGHSHLLLDNITTLACENLQMALTAPDCLWRDRILGVSESVSLPVRCTWGATANNMTGTVEQLRRCVEIRLDAKIERPEERSIFRHSDLPGYLRENYAKIVTACLTLIRVWVDAGCPEYSGANSPLGSFEGWTRVMGGILEAAGFKGFLDNRNEFVAQGDTEGHSIEEFANEWFSIHGVQEVSAASLLSIASRYFEDQLGDGSEKSQVIRLGKLLSRYRDWVLNGRVLLVSANKNGARYALKPTK